MMRQNSSRAIGSTPDVGSSRISRLGLWIIATASDRRCRRPSGRVGGSESSTSVSSKVRATSAARPAIVASGRRNRRACSSRFCRTVSSL